MRLLSEPMGLGLEEPRLTPIQIAFFRGLFGGVVMLALVRRGCFTFRPIMLGMVVTFTVMSCLYLSALGLGSAANAIFLQNTSPVWVTVFAVLILREHADWRSWQAVLLGGLGAVVIVVGGWPRNLPVEAERIEILTLFMGLGSGIAYAWVVLFLRVLREHSGAWLVALNLLGTAVTLGLFMLLTQGLDSFVVWLSTPRWQQLLLLLVFGLVQMALPYWLFTRGLRSVSPQEAGIITLIEPLLNPLWAFLLTPERDTPTPPMLWGGALILLALVWRYLPRVKARRVRSSETPSIE